MEFYQIATDKDGKVVNEKTDTYKMSMSKLGTALRKKTGWLSNQHLIDLKRHGAIIVQREEYKLRLEIKNAGGHEFTGRVIDYTTACDNKPEGN